MLVKELDYPIKSGNDPDIIALPLYGAGSDGIKDWIPWSRQGLTPI